MTTLNTFSNQIYFTEHCKKTGVAYALCLFFGMTGAHNFYLGKSGHAKTQLVFFALGIVSISLQGLGVIFLGGLFLWVLSDLFTIPADVKKANLQLMQSLGMELNNS